METRSHDQFLAEVEAFLVRHPTVGETTFGRRATGEPGLIGRLRRGSSPTLKLVDRIKAYMDLTDREAADHDATVEQVHA